MVILLNVDLAQIKLKSPLILASGILGTSIPYFRNLEKDVGSITTKSIGVKPSFGHETPNIIPLKNGILNSMGIPNPGIEYFKHEIKLAKSLLSIPIIVSVYGEDEDEFRKAAFHAEDAGADAIELNLSCPHKGKVSQFSESATLAKSTLESVSNSVKVPIFAKLSPNVSNISKIAVACENGGAKGICAINTLKSMKIDINMKKPLFPSTFGGLSGPPLHPIAVRCVYEIYQAVSIPIIGTGGVTNWQDAIELILAGAKCVGIGTSISIKGISIFKEINEGIFKYIEKNNYKSINDLVGLAHRSV